MPLFDDAEVEPTVAAIEAETPAGRPAVGVGLVD
jgi:hypothetical protein